MARRRPLFARARRAVRRTFVSARRASHRLRRRPGHARPAMGLVGKVGAGVAAVPLLIASLGNGSTFSGALGVWRKGAPVEAVAREFIDVLLVQYTGRTMNGAKWGGEEAYSGWTWLGYGAGLMLGDALAGKIARRLGVRSPRLPLIGRPISG